MYYIFSIIILILYFNKDETIAAQVFNVKVKTATPMQVKKEHNRQMQIGSTDLQTENAIYKVDVHWPAKFPLQISAFNLK